MILNSLSTRLRWTQGIRVHSRLSRARLLFSVLLPLAFSVQPCHAAVQQAWVAKYNSGPGSTNPPAGVALDADANVYVAGSSTRSSPPYDLDYVVIKYSPTGEQLWVNRFGSP